MKMAGNTAKDMKSSILGTIGKIGAGIGLLDVAKNSVMLASSLVEVQNVVDTTFGSTASTINSWSQSALKSFGLTQLQAQKFTGTLGAMIKTSGISGNQLTTMSTNLAGLSGDFASFFNLDPEEAFDKIRSGIAGQSRPLMELGINMSVANLQAYALSQGITTSYKAMTQAQQVQLRYNYLMSVSKDKQGDFAKTSKTFANELRTTIGTLKQIGANIASVFLPALTSILGRFLDLLDYAPKIGQAFTVPFNMIRDLIAGFLSDVTGVFNFFNNNWGTISPIIMGVAGAILFFNGALKTIEVTMTVVKALQEAWAVVTGACNIAMMVLNGTLAVTPLGWITILIGGLIAGGVALYENWGVISAKAQGLWTSLTSAFNSIGSSIEGVFSGIGSAIGGFIDGAIDKLNQLINGFNSLTTITLPGWLGGGSIGLSVPNIPKFATGTQYFSGGLAQINERGGEIVNLPNGSKVIPADKTDKILNGSGGTTVQVIVQGNVIGNHDFANQMGEIITNKLKVALINN